MTEKILKSKTNEEKKSKFKQPHIDIAYEFSKRAYREFGDFIKAVVLFGSYARRSEKKASDIDILILVDDSAYKITEEVSNSYKFIMEKIIRETSDRIHATTLKLTNFWASLMKADPVIVNILREGMPILDSGFFEPVQMLLFAGKIRPTEESILTYLGRAPASLKNARNRLFQALYDLYWATVDSAHAAIMSLGFIPPVPSKIPEVIKKQQSDELFNSSDLEHIERVINLFEAMKNNELKNLSGIEIESLMKSTKIFIEHMADMVDRHLNQEEPAKK